MESHCRTGGLVKAHRQYTRCGWGNARLDSTPQARGSQTVPGGSATRHRHGADPRPGGAVPQDWSLAVSGPLLLAQSRLVLQTVGLSGSLTAAGAARVTHSVLSRIQVWPTVSNVAPPPEDQPRRDVRVSLSAVPTLRPAASCWHCCSGKLCHPFHNWTDFHCGLFLSALVTSHHTGYSAPEKTDVAISLSNPNTFKMWKKP